jgi:NTE family protein
VTEQPSVGINLNVTLRNLLFQNSRLIFDSFISENPVGGIKYFKYFGNDQNAFIFSEIKYTKDSRYEWQNLYSDPAGFKYREILAYLGGAYTINHNAVVGGSVGFLGAKMTPTTNPDTIVSSWNQSSYPINAFFRVNTFDQAVFPNSGLKILADVGYNFNIKHTAKLKSDFTTLTQDQVNDIVYVDPHMMFKFGIQQYIPLTKKLSLFVDARMVLSDNDRIGFNDYSKVGGVAPILSTGAPFWGVNRNEINVRQIAMASLGYQWNFYGDFYFKGKVNYLNTEYPMVLFSDTFTKEEFTLYDKTYTDILGYGLELAYNSAIGPVRFVVSQNQYNSDLNVFVGVGFNIYKSYGDF